jgi:ABC-type multidrug transport system fused ATPase/permease subunit
MTELPPTRDSNRRLLQLLKEHRGFLVYVYFLYFLNAVLNLVPGYSIRALVDFMAEGTPIRVLGWTLPLQPATNNSEALLNGLILLGLMLCLILLANAIGVLMWRRGTWFVETLIRDLKMRIHDHINNLSLRYFSGERTGRVMTKGVSDVTNFSNMLRQSFTLSYSVVQILLAPILMLSMSWQLFLLTILPVPLVAHALKRIRLRLRPLYMQQRETESTINSQLQETITGVREIKAFNMRQQATAQYRDVNNEFFDRQNRIMRIFSFNHQLQYGTKDFALILTVVGGGVMVYTGVGDVTVGTVLSFAVLQNFFYGPIGFFFGFYDMIQRGMVSWQRIDDFLTTVPEIKDRPGAREFAPPVIREGIRFDRVGFSYEGEKRTLNDVSFRVRAGERVAIVGASGSGKSTLISCMMRFYDIQDGAITFDGVDIREYTQESLRAAVGIVFQETFLFYGTVYSNLSYVNPGKSFEEIQEACRHANIHDDILDLPHGYDTLVGERGATLSGGQRQRLGIARAILRNPSIIILDEATSAVDTVTESLIQDSLEYVLRDRTAFIIAHRLSTIRSCDRILVMEHGRLVQEGTHTELLATHGPYRSLYEKA